MGQVKFNERSLNDGLQRFVDENIRRWLMAQNIGPDPTDYEVAFFDEDTLGEVSCLITVNSGARLWRSWETATNPRLAFNRSLEHLHPDLQH